MPQILVANAKGLFADTSWRFAITEQGLSRLAAELPELQNTDPAAHKIASELLELLSALPACSAFLYLGRNDLAPGEAPTHVTAEHPHGYSYRPCRGWLSVGTFSSKSSSTPPEAAAATPEALGWVAAEQLAKREPELLALLRRLELGEPDIARAKGVVKRSAAWTLSAIDPYARLASADSFAVYKPGSHGFLNDKGGTAPLAGARLFESAAAASRTISSRGLDSAVVVAVSARVLRLDPIRKPSTDLGPLLGALATEEARQMREALRLADVAALRERLAELEAASAAQNGADPAPAPAPAGAPRKRL
jgi:hypothetical protein